MFNGKKAETLCWSCKNSGAKCSWSKEFKPVKGWEAIPTRIRLTSGSEKVKYIFTDSYCVIKCPEYIPDIPKRRYSY